MSEPTKHQMVEFEGNPIFVLVPYPEYLELTGRKEVGTANIPLEVAEIALMEEKSLIRAWREHRGLTQEAVAARVGISRGAYAQMEALRAKPRRVTLHKIAMALGIRPEQLAE